MIDTTANIPILQIGMVIKARQAAIILTSVTLKLILIFYFMIFTGPTATHALAEAALQSKLEPLVDDREA